MTVSTLTSLAVIERNNLMDIGFDFTNYKVEQRESPVHDELNERIKARLSEVENYWKEKIACASDPDQQYALIGEAQQSLSEVASSFAREYACLPPRPLIIRVS